MIRPFERWTYEELENSFGLARVENHETLATWLEVAELSISPSETASLQTLQKLLHTNVDDWNEEELKVFFIGPLLTLVGYYQPRYRPFLERKFSAKIGNIELQGIVDFMLASGRQQPKQPYFCFHEYKRVRGRDNDPLGQLLAAMLCAQAKNSQVEQPIYGVFVEGRFWYFVVLAGKEYAVTEPFTATQNDLWDIFKILQKLKPLIEKWL